MANTEDPILPGNPSHQFEVGFGFDGFESMTVVAADEATLVSRHVLSEEEAARVARTRTVYVLHPHDCPRLPPVRVAGRAPEFTLPVFVAEMSDGARAVFHGLEVTDAGGSELDRADFAAAEAAVAVTSRASLPCRVALLNEKMTWVELGGEVCSTRDRLEAAAALRLKKMFAEGGKRFEARDAAGGSFRVDLVELTPAQCREGERALVHGGKAGV